MTSKHYSKDRKEREQLIKQIGTGKVLTSFIIDKGHVNGKERHEITSTGIIIIYNNKTNKMITKLIARPNQIKRYYEEGKAPQELLKIAKEHQEKGYNK